MEGAENNGNWYVVEGYECYDEQITFDPVEEFWAWTSWQEDPYGDIACGWLADECYWWSEE